LRQANGRFVRRFETIERYAHEHELKLEEMTLEQMDALWNQAKDAEA
jgi:tetrapyrrole methylase family protein/MazG family protein